MDETILWSMANIISHEEWISNLVYGNLPEVVALNNEEEHLLSGLEVE